MLTLSPVQLHGGHYALPLSALSTVGLEATRRRFLSPSDAVAWFLTAPWTQPKQNHGRFCPACLSTSSCRKSCPVGGRKTTRP